MQKQLLETDSLLKKMEQILGGFQADLGDISEEIRYLQDESFSMNIKLRNRKLLDKNLSEFIDKTLLPLDLLEFAKKKIPPCGPP